MIKKLKDFAKVVKTETAVYKGIIKDSRTPFFAKLFLGIAVGYALMPFDLIPDFIPVLGYLDDIIIIAVLVITALKIVPKHVVDYHRNRIALGVDERKNIE